MARLSPPPRPPSPTDWRALLERWDPHAARRPAGSHAARLLAAKGERRAAQAVYLEIVDRAPDDIGAWRSLAALHREYGEHAAGRQNKLRFRHHRYLRF